MALYYLDTSALVKLYVREPGTERMLSLADGTDRPRLALLSLARVELHSAVWRRQRLGDLDQASAERLLDAFEIHATMRFLRQNVNDLVLDLACALVGRHQLRAYDALQLAGCMAMRSTAPETPVFVCADQQLSGVASLEGLVCLDPTR